MLKQNGADVHALARDDGDRVMSFRQWCALNNFSAATGRRVLAAGAGPPVIRLSSRRIGIRLRDNRAWQDQRANVDTPNAREPAR